MKQENFIGNSTAVRKDCNNMYKNKDNDVFQKEYRILIRWTRTVKNHFKEVLKNHLKSSSSG